MTAFAQLACPAANAAALIAVGSSRTLNFPNREVGEHRVDCHGPEQVRVTGSVGRISVGEEVDPAVRARFVVGDPHLGEETGPRREGEKRLRPHMVLVLSGSEAFEAEGDDSCVHRRSFRVERVGLVTAAAAALAGHAVRSALRRRRRRSSAARQVFRRLVDPTSRRPLAWRSRGDQITVEAELGLNSSSTAPMMSPTSRASGRCQAPSFATNRADGNAAARASPPANGITRSPR